MDYEAMRKELAHIKEHIYAVEGTLTGLLADEDLVHKESPLGELLQHLHGQITNAEIDMSALQLKLQEVAEASSD